MNGAKHYVYVVFSEASGQFYIGSRTVHGNPADDPYMGSGNWARRQYGLQKEIIKVFGTRAEAEALEKALIEELKMHQGCRNLRHASNRLEGLSFKVTQAFRRRYRLRAVAAGMKLNDLLEEALACWERDRGITQEIQPALATDIEAAMARLRGRTRRAA